VSELVRTHPADVRDMISRAFIARGIGRAALAPYRPRASSAGACIRALTYHRAGVPPTDPLEPEVGLTLELGSLLHEYLVQCLRDYGLRVEEVEREVHIPFAHGTIAGHIDVVVGGSTIVDFKSASRASFDAMVERNAPLPQHRAQVTLYLHACRLMNLPYTHAVIVAYCKDPGNGRQRTPWVSPLIEYDPELAARLIRMFEAVEEHARAGTLPERPYTVPTDYPCRGCQWRSLCWDTSQLRSDTTPDLPELEATAARYAETRDALRQLERQRDALAGTLKAALIDAHATCARAGDWEIRLSQHERITVDPQLVPPEVLREAARTTVVTQIHVTHKPLPDPIDPTAAAP
jgi:CRISPR/Cas system-associated exonuclease Cas4 (RecB family)